MLKNSSVTLCGKKVVKFLKICNTAVSQTILKKKCLEAGDFPSILQSDSNSVNSIFENYQKMSHNKSGKFSFEDISSFLEISILKRF